jgi:hypothetical protein
MKVLSLFNIMDTRACNNISEILAAYSPEEQREIEEYMNDMDDMAKKCCRIAFEHLGSSFNILRSNGFKEWKAKKIANANVKTDA